MSQRLGEGLEWAAVQARRVIHDNDLERLRQLLAEHPQLLSWQGNDWDSKGGLLGIATGAYADSFDPEREQIFTRAACAELLIDAGAVVMPSVCEGLIESRARGLLQLFRGRGLLPHTLKFFSALGDLDAVRAALDANGHDRLTVDEAFLCACRFEHQTVASLLLERCIALDSELGKQIDRDVGRAVFIKYLIDHRPPDLARATEVGPWKTFVVEQIKRAIVDRDLTAFVGGFQQAPSLLDDLYLWFQVRIIEIAVLNDREAFIAALLDLNPALLRRQPPPQSQALEFAITYAHTHLIPVLTRIWPLPDDLPHAAATGNLTRVKHWFDESGRPSLGDLDTHYPYNDTRARAHLQWNPGTAQQVLDVALAFAVINRHFGVADFLLEHGADINTHWNSHEPASILHHLVFLPGSYESMRFLIDRGIDMTINDYRWNSTAHGWALYGKNDLQMAQWLEGAEREQAPRR